MKKIAVYCRNENERLITEQYAEKQNFAPIFFQDDEKNSIQFTQLCAQAPEYDQIIIVNAINALSAIHGFTDALKKLTTSLIFINTDLTVCDSADFMLTTLSELEQLRRKMRSNAIKQGKQKNAEKGKVPNLVYGYNKTDDAFGLEINANEAQTVRRIFNLYINDRLGANRIAQQLNKEGLTTKRGCKWSQVAVSRILSNELYIGKIINGKQTITAPGSRERTRTDKKNWITVSRPELRIIDDTVFKKANALLRSRKDSFGNKTPEERHIFSTLIKCKYCGSSFRRQVRKYKNEYVRWVCTGRNANGADTCPNNAAINEQELVNAIRDYFTTLLNAKSDVSRMIKREYEQQYHSTGDNIADLRELSTKIDRLNTHRQKQLQLYDEDIISIRELKESLQQIDDEINQTQTQYKMIENRIDTGKDLDEILNDMFTEIENVLQSDIVTNSMLDKLIDRLVVDENQNVEIYLKIFTHLGLDENLLA